MFQSCYFGHGEQFGLPFDCPDANRRIDEHWYFTKQLGFPDEERDMRTFCAVLIAGALTTSAANAAVVYVSDSTAPWIGFMNVYELPSNGGGFVFGKQLGSSRSRGDVQRSRPHAGAFPKHSQRPQHVLVSGRRRPRRARQQDHGGQSVPGSERRLALRPDRDLPGSRELRHLHDRPHRLDLYPRLRARLLVVQSNDRARHSRARSASVWRPILPPGATFSSGSSPSASTFGPRTRRPSETSCSRQCPLRLPWRWSGWAVRCSSGVAAEHRSFDRQRPSGVGD